MPSFVENRQKGNYCVDTCSHWMQNQQVKCHIGHDFLFLMQTKQLESVRLWELHNGNLNYRKVRIYSIWKIRSSLAIDDHCIENLIFTCSIIFCHFGLFYYRIPPQVPQQNKKSHQVVTIKPEPDRTCLGSLFTSIITSDTSKTQKRIK